MNVREDRKMIRFIVFNLFIFFLGTYLLTASGADFSDVAELRVEVARSIMERLDLDVPNDMGMKGADGREYSWFGIGPVLLFMPLYLTAKSAGIPPENLVSIMNHLFGAATSVLVFLFSISLGYSKRASVIASISYGLGTMAWYYSKDSGDHTIETFFILFSIYSMHCYTVNKKGSYLFLSALSFGFALITRPTSILVAPSLFIMNFFNYYKKSDLRIMISQMARDVSLFSISLLPFICLNLWYNYYRFNSIFETGHRLMAARLGVDYFNGTPFFIGLSGFLASPGKGFFYYSPIAILFFFSIKAFSKKHHVISFCFIFTVVSYLFFYSKNLYWHGAGGWGPRYIFAITPFLIIPIAELFDSALWQKKMFIKVLVSSVFALSLAVQLASISVNRDKYRYYLTMDEKVKYTVTAGDGVQPIVAPPLETYFDWHMSPIFAQFKFIDEMIWNLKDYKYSELSREASTIEKIKVQPWMNVFDFWWFYMFFIEDSYLGFIVALLLIFISIFSAMRIWKAIK